MADLRIGGMALKDGVLLQSQDNWAAAVRLPDGSIKVRSGAKSRLPGRGVFDRVPVVRGVSRLIETTIALPAMRRELGRPVLPQEEPALLAAALASATATVVLRKTMKRAPLAASSSSRRSRSCRRCSRCVSPSCRGSTAPSTRASPPTRRVATRRRPPRSTTAAAPTCSAHCCSPVWLAGSCCVPRIATSTRCRPWPWGSSRWVRPSSSSRGRRATAATRWPTCCARPVLAMQRVFTTREPSGEQLDVAQSALGELLKREGVAPAPIAAVSV